MRVEFESVFNYPIESFKNHLETEDNERILFSGKYGIGKTSFLKNIFSKDVQLKVFGVEKYDVYHLFPVNYSISSNEDILKYIKYDIICEFLKKGIAIDDVASEIVDSLPFYIKKRYIDILVSLLKTIPKLGKEVSILSKEFDKLKSELAETHREDEGNTLVKYLERQEAYEGGLYESDLVTKIIAETVSGQEKTPVLIVDDMDRLDPEHVFRILNVFSSQFDRPEECARRFGFNKVVVVCDINNIRQIYYHKYGHGADFLGYIDKFYSIDVFFFDNKRAVKDILKNILSSGEPVTKTKNIEGEVSLFQHLCFNNEFVINIIQLLIDRSLLSLRALNRWYGRKFSFAHETIDLPGGVGSFQAFKRPISMQIMCLNFIVGGFHQFDRIISVCMLKQEQIDNIEYYYGYLIEFISRGKIINLSERVYEMNYNGRTFHFQVEERNNILHSVKYQQVDLDSDGNRILSDPIITPKDFWDCMLDVTETLYKQGLLTS